MMHLWHLLFAVASVATLVAARGNEITFEMEEREVQCFFEDATEGERFNIDFQVVYGGNLDIDVELTDTTGEVILKKEKVQYESHIWDVAKSGTFKICFSNRMSTFAHKTIYFNVIKDFEDDFLTDDISSSISALTQLEASMSNAHYNFKQTLDFQVHHRMQEASGRALAEEINEQVMWWSALETLVIILCGLGQVYLVKGMFNTK